jgi:small subunit ribosomal protein S15
MARMYSRRKGKSGSRRPSRKDVSWVKYKPKELEDIIENLAKKELSASRIGIVLRDQYGIPSVRQVTKEKITRIMEKKGVKPELPETLLSLMKRAVGLRNHLEEKKKDYISQRGLELTESKIRRLVKYYKKEKILPVEWKYQPDKAKLLVK